MNRSHFFYHEVQYYILHSTLIKVYAEVLDAAGGTLFSTGQVFQSGDCLFGTEVDNEQMGLDGPFLRLPEGARSTTFQGCSRPYSAQSSQG